MATTKELEERIEKLENFIKKAFQLEEIPSNEPVPAPVADTTDGE